MDDEFDILQLRQQLRDATGPDRRKSSSASRWPANRRATDNAPMEPRGPSLFEWAGIEELVAQVEHDEATPLAEAVEWPHLSAVPKGAENYARPFGRKADMVAGGYDQSVMHLVEVARGSGGAASTMGQERSTRMSEVQKGSAASFSYGAAQDTTSNLARRFVEETPEVPPDPYFTAEVDAEFVDIISPEELAAAERAAEELRQAINLLSEQSVEKARPAEALLNSLVNKLLLERDRLEACMSDHQAPLLLSPLRRRRGERDHVDLSTANDRG